MAPTMTAAEYVKKQERDIERFRLLAQTNPELARAEAMARLVRAGILTEDGELAPYYRD